VLEGLVGTGYLGLVACVGKGKHTAARLYCPVALARYVLYPGWACQPINVPRSKNFYFILLGGKRKAFASPFLLPSWMAQQGIMCTANFIRYAICALTYTTTYSMLYVSGGKKIMSSSIANEQPSLGPNICVVFFSFLEGISALFSSHSVVAIGMIHLSPIFLGRSGKRRAIEAIPLLLTAAVLLPPQIPSEHLMEERIGEPRSTSTRGPKQRSMPYPISISNDWELRWKINKRVG